MFVISYTQSHAKMGRSQRSGKTMQKKSICYFHKQLRQRTNNNTTRIRNTIFHAINFARRTIWKVCIFQHVVCFFPLSHFLSVRFGFFLFQNFLVRSFIHLGLWLGENWSSTIIIVCPWLCLTMISSPNVQLTRPDWHIHTQEKNSHSPQKS